MSSIFYKTIPPGIPGGVPGPVPRPQKDVVPPGIPGGYPGPVPRAGSLNFGSSPYARVLAALRAAGLIGPGVVGGPMQSLGPPEGYYPPGAPHIQGGQHPPLGPPVPVNPFGGSLPPPGGNPPPANDPWAGMDPNRINWNSPYFDRNTSLGYMPDWLYNQRPQWLDNYHRALDKAVLAAYGWPEDSSDTEILERLLALNQSRAARTANA